MSTNFCPPVNNTPWNAFPGNTFNFPTPSTGTFWNQPQFGYGYGPNGWWFGNNSQSWFNSNGTPAFGQWNAWNTTAQPWNPQTWPNGQAWNCATPWSNQSAFGWNTTPWSTFNHSFGGVPGFNTFQPTVPNTWNGQTPGWSNFAPSFGYGSPAFSAPWNPNPWWNTTPNTPWNATWNTNPFWNNGTPWNTGGFWNNSFPAAHPAWNGYTPANSFPTGYTPIAFTSPNSIPTGYTHAGNTSVNGATFGFPTGFPTAFGNGMNTPATCAGREAA